MADQALQPVDHAENGDGTIPSAEGTLDGTGTVAETPPAPESIETGHEDLLGELARAMHVAATSQYERMNAELERRRTEQVDAIATRTGMEIESLKAGSEADIEAIDTWAEAEGEKIKLERTRRIEARREQLASQLERQDTIKAREVVAIEAAIDAHRKQIDKFFGRMERETDPASIASLAATIPPFPNLAEVAEAARREAVGEFASVEAPVEAAPPAGELDPDSSVTESRLMAVMDPDAGRGRDDAPTPAWEAPYAVSVAAGTGVSSATPEAEHSGGVGSTLLRTVRSIRPMAGSGKDDAQH